ncbi:alpha/beta hydrolase [Croceicoccus estronivorus]|uniref:alpha/beta hydrolase n=1 Tax=Croceicoccus estronivorus TaxID=1172626 RepID=UPI000832A3C6|nr:alpha/beta hydrolase [Croceicoccus estronivorus]OCC23898.1 alpha/beta hydrolase [Croceicoccus estronivorus]
MTDTLFHIMADGRRIAYRSTPDSAGGDAPALVFLPGYMSDMAGGKATALFDWAKAQGRACLLLDYSGCGESDGDFADGTLSRWREEVLDLIAATLPEKKIALIGSSMGGWLMLLVGRSLGDRLAALVGIAAAPDFTTWGKSQDEQTRLAAGEIIYEDNPYGPEPTPTHPGFWQDGQARLQLEREIPLDCPVRLIHGQCDADVPWEIALRTAERLRSRDVQIIFVKDGEHRFSRDSDINLILRTVAALPGTQTP